MKLNKGKIGQIIFLIAVIALIVFPIYWIIQSSFQPRSEVVDLAWYPHTFTLENFHTLTKRAWALAIKNSMIISFSNMALCLAVGFPAAYAFTRYKFVADKHLFFWFIINRLVPPAVFVVPFLILYINIGLYDTLIGVVIVHTLFNLPLSIWILSGFMSDIPTHVDEQAFIDGAGYKGYFRRILIPLMEPGIGVTAFFLWLFSWSEMLLASTVTRNAAYPLTVQILTMKTSMMYGVGWGQTAAAGVISIIPGIILLYFVRKYIARGFVLGKIR